MHYIITKHFDFTHTAWYNIKYNTNVRNNTMHRRLIKETKICVCFLAGGISYLIFTLATGFSIPCPFHLITGLLCPGCGATRMFISIAKFDFPSAYQYNKVLFVTFPFLLFVWLFEKIAYIKTGKNQLHLISKITLWTESILLIIYGVIRNIG